MQVHVYESDSLSTPQQVRGLIRVTHEEANRGRVTVIVSDLRGVTETLAAAAESACSGGTDFGLREIENRHFEVIYEIVDVRRQSQVIAGVRHQINQLEDLLGSVALIRELSPRTRDLIASWGKWLSAYVFSEGLRELRPDVRLLDTRDLIVTDDCFTHARVNFVESRARIRQAFGGAALTTVATGGLGSTAAGEVTTLGLDGSRLVASVIAAAMEATEVVVWTDTDGILTTDPEKFRGARPIRHMTYTEAMEMMHFGGNFLYPPALIPAIKHRIPIRVKNVSNPSFEGTLISYLCTEARHVTGISCMDDIALLKIQGNGMVGVTGVASRLFGALAAAGVNVILITQASSEHSICAGVPALDALRAKRAVEETFRSEIEQALIDEVSIEPDLSIIAVVGERMKHTVGLAARIFGTLGESAVNIKAIAQGSSEQNISMVIDAADQPRALAALHRALIDDRR